MKLLNTKWFEVGERVFDLLLLNLLIVVCSIPIVTSFNAISSGYHVVTELIEGRCEGVIRSFMISFKDNFNKKFMINFITLLWLPSLLVLGKMTLSYHSAFASVLYYFICIEIVMSLMGAMVQKNKRVKLITLIKNGIIHFHVYWHMYFIISIIVVISILLMILSQLLIPVVCSLTLYIAYFVVKLLSRKEEGDIPISFLKVFEKTS